MKESLTTMTSARSAPVLGVDTGGTFTDFLLVDQAVVKAHKVLSTPDAPEVAILRGCRELGLDPDQPFLLRHGTTVATNAVLEGKGARVAWVTNAGFGDVLSLARQNRRQLYVLSEAPHPEPVPPELVFEVDVRRGPDGGLVKAMCDAELDRLAGAVAAAKPEAIAVCLLFSYVDACDEFRIAERLQSIAPVSLSSRILPEIGEYERGMATWLNAAVGPRISGYLSRLSSGLPGASISVMQSDGLLTSAAHAGESGVRLLLSGPAGGLQGARRMSAESGQTRLITIDIGGTSSDVALITGEPSITREGRIADYPVAVPMVDMHTVGAGGGSICWLDPQGMMHVGPMSAGADPGPACYGRGGTDPTTTDAMAVLGRLPEGAALGRDGVVIRRDQAAAAFEPLAEALGLSVTQAAQGAIEIINQNMAQALRVISVERGHDPRQFSLCAFGGAGGLHACELADLLGAHNVLVPAHAGVLSALGIALAAPGRETTRAVLAAVDALTVQDIEREFAAMAADLTELLIADGVDRSDLRSMFALDVRYHGQSYALRMPWRGLNETTAAFHEQHEHRFGHALDATVEVVNLCLRMQGPETAMPDGDKTGEERWIGPVTILEDTGAVWVAPGWAATRDSRGSLTLNRAINRTTL